MITNSKVRVSKFHFMIQFTQYNRYFGNIFSTRSYTNKHNFSFEMQKKSERLNIANQ